MELHLVLTKFELTEIPVPTSIKAAVSFIKMAEYYRNHIPNFSMLAQPLFALTKKDAKFIWRKEENDSFIKIKIFYHQIYYYIIPIQMPFLLFK